VGYRLGVDLGTTYTAAAVDVDGRAEMLGLGIRATQVPSVVTGAPPQQDGTQITFKRQDEVWVMDADGGDAKRVSTVGDVGTAAAWSAR